MSLVHSPPLRYTPWRYKRMMKSMRAMMLMVVWMLVWVGLFITGMAMISIDKLNLHKYWFLWEGYVVAVVI